MADSISPTERSRVMSRIRGRDTGPELALRRALWRLGARYRVCDTTVPGRPDIVCKARSIAVFVDGCFWHGCPKHYVRPSSRQDYWDSKISRNQDRRRIVLAELRRQGWKAIQVWECSIERNPERISARIAKVWRTAPWGAARRNR